MASKYVILCSRSEDIFTHVFHLVAYYTQNTLDQLQTVEDIPLLATVNVPHGAYKGARNPKRPARETSSLDRSLLQYPYQYQYQVIYLTMTSLILQKKLY